MILAPATRLDFSLSHSGPYWLLAVTAAGRWASTSSSTPGAACGTCPGSRCRTPNSTS
ncbi:hypothetical protein ACFQ3Z_29710 [Streptomyces nogalater]